MGALTFKPLAFQFRPWELTTTTVDNHVEGHGFLTFHMRGTQVQKVTAPGWLQDQTRFSYDGFRRQRLTTPAVAGVLCGWPTALATWLGVTAQAGRFIFKVDPVSSINLFWWTRLYYAAAGGERSVVVAVDTVVGAPDVYHGAFGLAGVTTAGVTFPIGLPYEDGGQLSPPVGVPLRVATAVAQLFTSGVSYRGFSWPTSGIGTPRVRTCALFQVSPLQRLLTWW